MSELIWMSKPDGDPEPVLPHAYWYAWSHGYRLCPAPVPAEQPPATNQKRKTKKN